MGCLQSTQNKEEGKKNVTSAFAIEDARRCKEIAQQALVDIEFGDPRRKEQVLLSIISQDKAVKALLEMLKNKSATVLSVRLLITSLEVRTTTLNTWVEKYKKV